MKGAEPLRCHARKYMRRCEGASAVEFAILAPLVVLLLFGIVVYGLLFASHLSLMHLSDETGRSTIAGLSTSERAALAEEYFDARLNNYPLLDQAAAELDVVSDGRFTTIVITYNFESHPIYALKDFIPLPGSSATYTQTIRDGGPYASR